MDFFSRTKFVGTGIISLLCAKSGAKHVYACSEILLSMVSDQCFLEIMLAIVLLPLGVSLRFRCCSGLACFSLGLIQQHSQQRLRRGSYLSLTRRMNIPSSTHLDGG
ncbi:hypothetical protein GUJ93_ZPchr0010g7333 [Zizania palustris]|uniref:Uncharacterized protein n=1 Tax=Zizania palustris TaxID=103762 RepID=A0A8J6BRU6_ZIZPA|nr:hypothetical protein GUJ93_ZPchr0010g7333 [Zizania palustris]